MSKHTSKELQAMTAALLSCWEWLERTKCSVQWNSRIGEWTVQKQDQTCGCIGRDRKILAALDKAREAMP